MFSDAVRTSTLQEKGAAEFYSKIEFFAPLVVQDLEDHLLPPAERVQSTLSVSKNEKRLSSEQGSRLHLIGQLGHEMRTDFKAQLHRRRITGVNLQDPVAGTKPDLVASRPTMGRARH